MLRFARYAYILISAFVFSIYVPFFYGMLFDVKGEKTHLFYSPVIKKFVWTESVPNNDNMSEADKHHGFFVYTDEDRNLYDRQNFEKLLPFIYYRNMELWGLLPIEIDGVEFTANNIRDNRLVTELAPVEIIGSYPSEAVYPLIESMPDEVRLVLPEDRFRIGKEMEFINADSNSKDEKLTTLFTKALEEKGFSFPGKFVGGRLIILKPFDEGVFLTDSHGKLFHVKRVKGEPWVVDTEIKTESGVRFFKVLENSQKDFYGILLENNGNIHLVSYDNYKLVSLNLENYDAYTMDFKLISDPIYHTAIYSDEKIIYAVAMDKDFNYIRSFKHQMQGVLPNSAQKLFTQIVPFHIPMKTSDSLFINLTPVFYPVGFFISGAFSLIIYILVYRRRISFFDMILLCFTGIYGLPAVIFLKNL